MIYYNIEEWGKAIEEKYSNIEFVRGKNKQYANIPVSFDIETSSFYYDEEKTAVMYVFALDVSHETYIGRTWIDFKNALSILENIFDLPNKKKYVIIYVHNLSYEFQFLSYQFEWTKIFALQRLKLIYATTGNFEFRCSYLLSGYSLEKLAENRNLPVKKLVGELDYKKIRLSKTLLTDEEIAYLENDVEIIIYYIEELIKEEGKISKIPLTKTAYVRRLTRENMFQKFKNKKLIHQLTLEPEQYLYLKSAFQGGFTHANFIYAERVVNDVSSFDIVSSYPAVMCSEKFPMTKAHEHDAPLFDEIKYYLKYYCCILDIEFYNIRSNSSGDHPISSSRSEIKGYNSIDNGRIITAEYIHIIITEQDLFTILDFYDFDFVSVKKILAYHKSYLPREIIMTILELYKDKTELKGVAGKEIEYMQLKERLNSIYGMIVCDIVRDDYYFDNGWQVKEKTLVSEIAKYNNDRNRFLYYPWGVYVSAYARRNLFKAIKAVGADYVYSDTDSVKLVNIGKHQAFFENYNETIKRKVLKCLQTFAIDEAYAHPLTKKGKEKWIGVFEYEGTFDYFKTMGAKRYMTCAGDVISLTVAGLNKNRCIPYILEMLKIPYKKDDVSEMYHLLDTKRTTILKIFDFFCEKMYIPKGKTGKNTHTYIDDPREGDIYDYLGELHHFYERSGVHLEEADYSMSSVYQLLKDLLNYEEITTA